MSVLQIALAVLGVGFLIAWHELGHYVVARALGMRVLRYSIGFGPRIWGFRKGEIDYQLAALPLGGFVQIKGMTPLEEGAREDPKSFINAARWKRWLVLAAGPGFNYILAAFFFFLYIWMWPSPVPTPSIEISNVRAGSPAAAAGLVPGDVIYAVDGGTLEDLGDFKKRLGAKAGAAVTLAVLRGEQKLDVAVTPIAEGGGYIVGFSPSTRYPRVSLLATAMTSVDACFKESARTLAAFGALFRREPGVDVSSPVRIVADMKDQIAQGFRFFLFVLAILSVNLGLLNLLPVPSLDGIKMLFLTIEGAVRRDLNHSFQLWVNAVGLIALLGLMVVLMARDTIRLIG